MNHLESPVGPEGCLYLTLLEEGRLMIVTSISKPCWIRDSYFLSEDVTIVVVYAWGNFELSLENNSRALKGFKTMAAALVLQCSTNWAMKMHTLGAGQFVEYLMYLVEHCGANAEASTEAMDSNSVENSKLRSYMYRYLDFYQFP